MKLRKTTKQEHSEHLCEAKVYGYSSFCDAVVQFSCDRPANWRGTKNFYCGLHKPKRKL